MSLCCLLGVFSLNLFAAYMVEEIYQLLGDHSSTELLPPRGPCGGWILGGKKLL